jgi:hypothetical protein
MTQTSSTLGPPFMLSEKRDSIASPAFDFEFEDEDLLSPILPSSPNLPSSPSLSADSLSSESSSPCSSKRSSMNEPLPISLLTSLSDNLSKLNQELEDLVSSDEIEPIETKPFSLEQDLKEETSAWSDDSDDESLDDDEDEDQDDQDEDTYRDNSKAVFSLPNLSSVGLSSRPPSSNSRSMSRPPLRRAYNYRRCRGRVSVPSSLPSIVEEDE